ncbi:hypothetical protein DPX39_100025000 [Trypanosoma brucei equiperdum]|uniref:Uncharacterized protein n=1 Tax=Trypanosoma brucei equiperdum TaxID=630700 RepID=A0A3L6KYV3_9TRYP|nr:hypothetical protein DPX39_100025000 [Trypanosoma brucei equiperdum]
MSVLHEVVIGTDDACRDGASGNDVSGLLQSTLVPTICESGDSGPHVAEQPLLVEVEDQVKYIRELLHNGGVPIEAKDVELIRRIADQLDQIYYWAVEEGGTFSREPSVLAQCEVPNLLIACTMTMRPRLVVSALSIMRHLLRHEQAGSHIFAEAEKAAAGGDAVVQLYEGDGFYGLIAGVMGRYAGLLELQTEAIAVACEAARFDIESILESAVISHVLSALQRHGENSAVQKEGVRLFSILVDIERADAVGCTSVTGFPNHPVYDRNNSMPTPTAVIFSHIGVVVSFVLQAVDAHMSNVEVKRNAVHFLRRCASYPVNISEMLVSGAYSLLLRALPHSLLLPDVFAELVETISAFVPLLDSLQRRGLALAIRRVLLESASPFHLSFCAALIVRLLEERKEHLPTEGAMASTPINESLRLLKDTKLAYSNLITLRDDDLSTFLADVSLPQLLCHAGDKFGDEDETLRQLVGRTVRLLAPSLR